MVTDALALALVSAADTAVIVTVAGDGTEAGAVYAPAVLITPIVASPPATPLTRHVTAVLALSVTVAANVCEPPVCTLTVAGETATRTGATASETSAVAIRSGSTIETASTRTVRATGMLAGAVY
jgi:hypothetical protein